MGKFVASFMLVFTLLLSVGGVSLATQQNSAGAVSCYVSASTPLSSNGYNYATASMGCSNGGAYNTYKVCIEQNGVDKRCSSARTSSDSYIISTSCQQVGNAYTARFRTHVYIYDTYGNYITSSGSGYIYLKQCY